MAHRIFRPLDCTFPPELLQRLEEYARSGEVEVTVRNPQVIEVSSVAIARELLKAHPGCNLTLATDGEPSWRAVTF